MAFFLVDMEFREKAKQLLTSREIFAIFFFLVFAMVPWVEVLNDDFQGLGSHCKAKTIGRGSSNEKSPFLLLPNQTKVAVPYDMKRSCIIVLMLPVCPRRYQGGLYNSIQTICLVLFS